MPPPNGSTGSTTAGSTSTAGTSRQPNWRPPTTVNTSPAVRSGAQKQSDRTCRCDSLGILFFAFILAKFVMKAVYTKLLADLTTAAVTLDRGAALAAFEKDRGGPPVYLATTAIIAWSVTLVIAPLLPAFSVKRRLLRSLAGLEEREFAALGCRRVQDLELDLVAQLLLITQVAFMGA